MTESAALRKLASIVAIDVAGYSRRTETDEEAAVRAVAELKARVTKAASAHGGRVFNTAGDGFMLEFPTATGALAAAEEIALAGDPPVRVGVHLGEVSLADGGDLLGHGVNVAARIQQMALPGAVLVSGDVKRAIRGPLGERLTPQGSVRLDKMSETLPVFVLQLADRPRRQGRRRSLKTPATIAASALLLAATGLGLWTVRTTVFAPAASKLAVLPFRALGGGQGTKDFATGLTDALQGVLSANQVQTVSTADAETLRGEGAAGRIDRLGVRMLLDGTATQDGGDTTVRVRLDDPHRHETLWTAEMSGPSAQPAALQAQVGARTIAVLNCAGRALNRHGGLSDPAALSLYFRACDLLETKGFGDDAEAVYGALDTLRDVTRRAPDFAPAHSDLAKFIGYYQPVLPPDQLPKLRREAEREARRALELDPKDPDAFVALAHLRPVTDRAGQERLYDQALAANPSWPSTLVAKGDFLVGVGRHKEALPDLQRASAANPLSLNFEPIGLLLDTGQPNVAAAELARLRALWPKAPDLWTETLGVYAAQNRWKEVFQSVDDTAAVPKGYRPEDVELIRTTLRAIETRDPKSVAIARRALTDLSTVRFQKMLEFRVVSLSAMGLVDDAFRMMDHYSADRMDVWTHGSFLFDSGAAAMRKDPRFMELAARLGFVDYWTKTGNWPDFCSEPGLPYDCKTEAAKLASTPIR
jgi:adenylate cyclase